MMLHGKRCKEEKKAQANEYHIKLENNLMINNRKQVVTGLENARVNDKKRCDSRQTLNPEVIEIRFNSTQRFV